MSVRTRWRRCRRVWGIVAARATRRLGDALRSTACLDALGNCIDLESVDASKNRSMCGALPVSWGCLIKLKEINVDETSGDGVAVGDFSLVRVVADAERETVRGARRGGDERDGRVRTLRGAAQGEAR